MNPEGWLATRSGVLSAWLAVLTVCGVAALSWIGYRATDEWQRSSAQLVEWRTQEVAALLTTALSRDMRAVQVSILDGREWDASSLAAPYEMNEIVQAAFARYPYPETFFAWSDSADRAFFLGRSDRRAAWLPRTERADTFPVEIFPSPMIAQPVFARVERDISARNQYSLFEISIAKRRYQVIARILYLDSTRDVAQGVLGFMVDLDWVRKNYFSPIVEQVTRVARAHDVLDTAITDETGEAIVGSPFRDDGIASSRDFPVLFFDPVLVSGGLNPELPVRKWSVTVGPGSDPTLESAARGAHDTLIVIGAGAFALGVGLFITARASRASAAVTKMRADFVSTVTHALKTPVSVISGIGETLIRGRVDTPERLREYAHLLVQESQRLTRLINNMLAYSRVTDAASVYHFEALAPGQMVNEVVSGFNRLLAEAQRTVQRSSDPVLPLVRADRTALRLALDNLFDNAMRYAGDSCPIEVATRSTGDHVEFSITDSGPGISPDDLARVQRRFARGRSTNGHGSGLGLAIASRIANDHGGHLRLESAPGIRTVATLSIPISK